MLHHNLTIYQQPKNRQFVSNEDFGSPAEYENNPEISILSNCTPIAPR